MADSSPLSGPEVVELPGEIDAANAEETAGRLRNACTRGAVVIADMTRTTFCDSRGIQELLKADHWAKASGCELRFARPSALVLRVWQLLNVDTMLAIYPTVEAAEVVDDAQKSGRAESQ